MTKAIKENSFSDCNDCQIKYLILNSAVMTKYKTLTDVVDAYHLDLQKVVKPFLDLMEEGNITIDIFIDPSISTFNEEDVERNVIFTFEGLKDYLKKRFKACYHLTSQGGEKWEKVANPEWTDFTVFNWGGIFGLDYADGITGTKLENVMRLLDIDHFIKPEKHIPGTEKWTEYRPFWATYWKKLENGYNVSYDTSDILTWMKKHPSNESELSKYQQLAHEEKEFIRQQQTWYDNIKNWYTHPQWYQDIISYQEPQ
jgi:hypothetical protein